MSVLDFWWQLLLCFIGVYLVANINFAILISQKIKRQDIRDYGSGNPGTTNMLRIFGFKMGLITFLLDFFKGVIAALLGAVMFYHLSAGDHAITMFSGFFFGLGAVLGHVFPVFLKFKGGKGFATGLGFLIVISAFYSFSWIFTIVFVLLTLAVVLIWDYVSVGAIFFFTAKAVEMIVTFFLDKALVSSGLAWWISVFMFLVWLTIIFAHRGNIVRLIRKEENKSNFKKIFKKKVIPQEEKIEK